MTDRTSCSIFAEILDFIEKQDSISSLDRHLAYQEMADFLWDLMIGYDFHPADLYAEDALIKFKLARKSKDGVEYKGLDY